MAQDTNKENRLAYALSLIVSDTDTATDMKLTALLLAQPVNYYAGWTVSQLQNLSDYDWREIAHHVRRIRQDRAQAKGVTPCSA